MASPGNSTHVNNVHRRRRRSAKHADRTETARRSARATIQNNHTKQSYKPTTVLLQWPIFSDFLLLDGSFVFWTYAKRIRYRLIPRGPFVKDDAERAKDLVKTCYTYRCITVLKTHCTSRTHYNCAAKRWFFFFLPPRSSIILCRGSRELREKRSSVIIARIPIFSAFHCPPTFLLLCVFMVTVYGGLFEPATVVLSANKKRKKKTTYNTKT